MTGRRKDLDYEPVGSSLFRSREEIEQEASGEIPAVEGRTSAQLHTRAAEPRRIRMSYNIREEQDVAIEEIQAQIRRKTGNKPTKSELCEEALDLLIDKYLH